MSATTFSAGLLFGLGAGFGFVAGAAFGLWALDWVYRRFGRP